MKKKIILSVVAILALIMTVTVISANPFQGSKIRLGFIQQKVDVIALSPVVESGWGPVLREAKAAGIPVILCARAIDEEDTSLWVTLIASDFVEEGRKAGRWLVEYLQKNNMMGKSVRIVELQGTTGSAPALDRKSGFEEITGKYPNLKIVRSQAADFTRTRGQEIMQAFLRADKNINVLFAHNDDMAIGAIEAIKNAGLRPGKERNHERD